MGHKNSKYESYKFDTNNRKNIYGMRLNECRSMNRDVGSWDMHGKCTELNGGVHQICVSQMKDDFSTKTSQQNWSKQRNNKPHCVCLGAYALYTAQNNHIDLKCDAIPETVFDPKYISKWNNWNGNEINNQGSKAIKKLYKYCYQNTDNKDHKEHLKNLYKNMKHENQI